MPPRIPEFPCLNALRTALPRSNGRQITQTVRTFSSEGRLQAKSKAGHRREYRDPYIVAQARARKAANLSKQEALAISRARALGDPVRGVETDFVRSFDTGKDPDLKADEAPLTNFLTQQEVDETLSYSKNLVEPTPKTAKDISFFVNRGSPQEAAELERLEAENVATRQRWEDAHETVQEVMKRITNIDNGNSKDRLRINKERCIETFGRHNTDSILPPRPLSAPLGPGNFPISSATPLTAPPKERKGPDTGSSEVQIAILTAKIRNLANHMERKGNNSDKVNKRNLRLLVHRRQKLLQYLRRKERAGGRWERCVSMLGLTEGTWRGEITL